MKTPVRLAAVLVAASLMTGCSSMEQPASTPPAATAEAGPKAADIATIDDAMAWARGLDDSVAADELSAGIQKISDLVPDLDIWFSDNNKIGGDLVQLNAAVLSAPDDAGTKVDDLNAIMDELEASIAKGNKP